MIKNLVYRNAFFMALGLHFLLLCMLMLESHSEHFVVHSSPSTELSMNSEEKSHPETQTQPLQAVSVDSAAVAETLNRLKTEREEKKQAELNHQQAVQEQLRLAQRQRVQEQQRLQKMKKEEAQMAAAHQKQMLAEKKHLQELAQQNVAQMSGEVNKYKALIIQAISQHWILPEHVDRQLFSQFRIQLAPNGQVLSVGLIRSSGDPVLDRSAQAAIYKASPLPVPTDSEMFNLFRDISLTVRPESTRG